MSEESDEHLWRRFETGDRLAFEALVRRWEGFVLRLASRILGDRTEAEEVRQTLFLKLFLNPRSVRHPDRLKGWLSRSTLNESIGLARKNKRRNNATARLRDRGSPPAEGLAELQIDRDEEAARLAKALAQLEPTDRALLALRFDEGMTFAEVAEVLALPVSTVKSREARLVARLRLLLEDPANGLKLG